MARDDDPWRRLRDREENGDDDMKPISKTSKLAQNPSGPMKSAESGSGPPEDKILEWMDLATPMIEQLNNLYNQYFSGVERVPPTERRKQLDQLMFSIQNTSKPTTGLQFRSGTLVQQYNTAKDRWDRMLRDLESGKIKRPGPGGQRR